MAKVNAKLWCSRVQTVYSHCSLWKLILTDILLSSTAWHNTSQEVVVLHFVGESEGYSSSEADVLWITIVTQP